MKKTILLLFLIFGLKPAFALCGFDGMQFFPRQKDISLNSWFIIEGYAMNQSTVHSFKNRKVYLESEDGELIELDLQEIFNGQMRLTQAILKPSKELKPHTTYFLKFADQTELEEREMMRYNKETLENEKISWRTTDKKSMESIEANLQIEFEKTKVQHLGCGASAHGIFNVKNKEESEVWYKTEFVDLATNEKTVYYIEDRNGKIKVGHGMCSGEFKFNLKGKYKVRFTPMNTDGEPLKTTEWKTFESPYMNDDGPFGNR